MKKKSYKPYAIEFSEGQGFMTFHCSTKEIAFREIKLAACELGLEDKIVFDKVELNRMYYCKYCETNTTSEPNCYDCGRDLPPQGRQTFTYYF